MLTLIDNPIAKKIIELVLVFIILSMSLGLTYLKGYENGKNEEDKTEKAQLANQYQQELQDFKTKSEQANEQAYQSQQEIINNLQNEKDKVNTVIKYVNNNPEYTCDNNKAVINKNDVDLINNNNIDPYEKDTNTNN